MNPADRAAIESAKANAAMARRDAGLLMESGGENARMFTDRAEQQLAQGIAILGKTGNLSLGENAPIQTGVGVGEMETPEAKKYRSDTLARIAELKANPELEGDVKGLSRSERARRNAEEIANLEEALKSLGPAGGGQRDIALPTELLHASGSDLLTMITTRDMFERDKRTIMRGAQNEAMSMLLAGENYDEQAGWAKQAADWNTFNTVLGTGLKIAGMFF